MKKGQPKGYEVVTVTANVDTGIRPEEMEIFKSQVKEGGILIGRGGNKIMVRKIYPHYVMTSEGSYLWIDLYMHNVRKRTSTGDGYEFRFQVKK